MPSDDTFKLKEDFATAPTRPTYLMWEWLKSRWAWPSFIRIFTYPHGFLESSGHCCSDNRGSTVLVYGEAIFFWCQPYIEGANAHSDASLIGMLVSRPAKKTQRF